MLCLGVGLGLIVGVVPGIGGLVGLTLLLPLTFAMDPATALAVLIGMHAVVATADAIPAVLFGVPGTIGSAATVVDGYPMSQRGEARRALGAAFGASMIGGLFGAIMLVILIPVLRPLVLSIGTPEMLALCVLGLSLAASLSGRYMLRGLAVACLGLILSLVGEDFQHGTMRWTYGTLYLWDGIPLVPFALGLFALPEIADLAIRRTTIARVPVQNSGGQSQGFLDVLHHPFVVLRSSAIGAGLGALPGLGSAVIDWIAYGSTVRGKHANAQFGHGDVRGVIASEAANNAKEGGALVPTIAFGVPGSASMSILLGAFAVHGIVPGPNMLGSQLDVTFVLVISLAVANVIGAGLCFLLAPTLARVAQVPVGLIVPVVLAITFLGAFQGGQHWGDLVVLFGAGLLGFMMRCFQWPRSPLILGFVLGLLVERYLATSVQIYGADFLLRPGVLVLLAIGIVGLARSLLPALRSGTRVRRSGPRRILASGPDLIVPSLLAFLFVLTIVTSASWPMGTRLLPQISAMVGLGLVILFFLQRGPLMDEGANPTGLHLDLVVLHDGVDKETFLWRILGYFAWLGAFAGLAAIIGPLAAIPVWIISYMQLGFQCRPIMAVLTGAAVFGASFGLFHHLLNVRFPSSLTGFF